MHKNDCICVGILIPYYCAYEYSDMASKNFMFEFPKGEKYDGLNDMWHV